MMDDSQPPRSNNELLNKFNSASRNPVILHDRELYADIGALKAKVERLEADLIAARADAGKALALAETLKSDIDWSVRIAKWVYGGAVALVAILLAGVVCPVLVEVIKAKWITPPAALVPAAAGR